MTFAEVARAVQELRSPMGQTSEAIDSWYEQRDTLGFLGATTDDDVAIYVSDQAMFLYGMVVALDKLEGEYQEDLLGWNFMVPSVAAYPARPGGPKIPEDYCEAHETRSAVLADSEPVFFHRPFEGVDEAPCIEMNQRLSHLLGLHAMPDQRAWCVLDGQGRIVPAARWGVVDSDGRGLCCTLRRRELDVLLYRTRSCLIRVFDVTRAQTWGINYGSAQREEVVRSDPHEVVARRYMFAAAGAARMSVLRGFQVVRCSRSDEEMALVVAGEEPREYATFLIQDWKNRRVVEWSAAPDRLGNYFVESDLPFGTSPAFFSPELLIQYRQDPERYVIGDRIIQCRGAWQVRYDINAEGQVHAYICDLAYLPYEEQLRWKAFNVMPSGTISQRAYQTDFLGSWDDVHEPLRSLKDILGRFPQHDRTGRPCSVWRMPDLPKTQDLDFLGYVVTSSRKEWEDQVLALSRILVDGLDRSSIQNLARTRSCFDPMAGSITQLDRLLTAAAVDSEVQGEIVTCLQEVQRLRSSKVAHPGGHLPAGDLRVKYRELVQRCDGVVRQLAAIVESGVLLAP